MNPREQVFTCRSPSQTPSGRCFIANYPELNTGKTSELVVCPELDTGGQIALKPPLIAKILLGVAERWHPTKNGDLTPNDGKLHRRLLLSNSTDTRRLILLAISFSVSAAKKVCWLDPVNGEEKIATVRSQTQYQKKRRCKEYVRD